jgi:hypothetical protein
MRLSEGPVASTGLSTNQEIDVIRRNSVALVTTCAALLLAGPAYAQATSFTPRSVTTTVAAPIFASADDSTTPLMMVKQGSRLTVIDGRSGWHHVTFKTPGDGRLEGYIRIKNVAPAAVDYSGPKQLNLAVPAHTLESRRTYQTLRADIRRRFEQSSRPTPPIGDARYRGGTGTIDKTRPELKPDATLDGFHRGEVRRFRY